MRRFLIFAGVLVSISTWGHHPDVLLFPDPRFVPTNITKTLPASNSTTATEANLGVEVVSGTNVVDVNGFEPSKPEFYGTPSSSTLSVTVSPQQGGEVDTAATWKYVSGSTTVGATPLYVPTGAETIVGVLSGDGYQNARGLAHSDGSLVVVAERTLGTDGVVAFRRTATGSAWAAASTATIWTTSTAFTSTVHGTPVLCQVPTDTSLGVVDVMFSLEVTSANVQTLRRDYSTDGGNTWSSGGYSTLTFDVSSDTYELHDVIYDQLAKEYTLVIRKRTAAPVFSLLTYISSVTEKGLTWTLLSGATASISGETNQARLGYYCGAQYMVQIDINGNMNSYRRVGGEFTWTTTEATIAGATYWATGHLGFVIRPNGQQFVYARLGSASHKIQMIASSDAGATWGRVYNPTTNTTLYPYNDDTAQDDTLDDDSGALANGLNINGAIYDGGTVRLIGNLTSAGTDDLSLMAVRFGEYSNLQLSTTQASTDVYYPANIVSTKSSAYTVTLGGATTETLVIDAADHKATRLSTDNSASYWTLTGLSGGEPRTGHLIFGASSTLGALATDDLALRVRALDTATTSTIDAEVRIDAANRQLRMYNTATGAALGAAAVTYAAGAPVEILLSVDADAAKASSWYKLTSDTEWTAISTNQTIATTGTVGTICWRFGKLAASAAQFDVLFFRGSKDNYSTGVRTTTSSGVIGMPAMSTPDTGPDRIPGIGLHVAWPGAELDTGATWTAQAFSSSPISFSSPFSVSPSPLRPWTGTTGSAAASYRIVYDFGSAYRGKLGRHWIFASAENAPGIASMVLGRWDSAAWQTEATGSAQYDHFTAGATGWLKNNALSYTVMPNASNADPKVWRQNELKGFWAVFTSGGDAAAGQILANGPGQFTTATGALQAWIELDPSTVVTVSGGGWGAIASPTNGTLAIYAPNVTVLSDQDTEAVRYYALTLTLASGATVPSAGLLTAGLALPLARPVRGGSSMRYIADPRLDRPRRIIEMPYDELLPRDQYVLYGATTQNTLSFDGSTQRATVDNNVGAVVSMLQAAGKRFGARRGSPIGLIVNADIQAEPGTTDQSFVGDDVMWGYVADSADVTAGNGFLFPRDPGDPSQHGVSFTLDEASLWLSTVGG